MTTVDDARRVMTDAKTEIQRLRFALNEINGHAHCCVIQRVPSDDNIIAEHIAEIERLAKKALFS